MGKVLLFLFMLGCGLLCSQTISPEVINTAGGNRQAGVGVWISDNVGEPFVQTFSNNNIMVTQGFLQPEITTIGGFTCNSLYQSAACAESIKDAFISVEVKAPVGRYYTTRFIWTPSEVCPNSDCSKIDTLKAGSYNVKVVVSYTTHLGTQLTDTIKTENFVIENPVSPCKIVIYQGVTPNNDGINDTWIIDNISDYPNNRVTIYSRWGTLLAEIKSYNNKDKAWPTSAQLHSLSSSTYFYVIELEAGATPLKGWVELIKNK